MLKILRRIIQEASTAPDLPSTLTLTVNRIRDLLKVAVCAVYLADQDNRQWVLMAAAGLNPDLVGNLRLSSHQGWVGLIAERQEPLALEDTTQHPLFSETVATFNIACPALLGVPLIQYRHTLGVLLVQDTVVRRFLPEEVDFLVTLAIQLASIFNHALLSGATRELLNPLTSKDHALQGLAGAGGIAIGTITVPHLLDDLRNVPDRPANKPAEEEAQFRAAIAAVDEDLRLAAEKISPLLPPTEQALFSVHRLLLKNDSLLDETSARIQAGAWAPAAWRDTVLARARLLEQVEDPYLSTRAEDIRNLGRRVLHYLQRRLVAQAPRLPERCVLFAAEMSVAHLAAIPAEHLAGIVCLRGSALSHVAILARAKGIPAVMGLGDRAISRFEGCDVIVDGYQGRIFINPTASTRTKYQALMNADHELTTALNQVNALAAVTLDGYVLPLYAKAGLPSDISAVHDCGADGIGLYRTEFAFMMRDSFPNEDEQCELYRQILVPFSPKPVVIRTLDIGGDKSLPYFRIEENNPFLGWRGMRFMLDQPDLFLTQLRALLRANAGINNLRILFPMITTVEEVDEALRLLHHAHRELTEEGLAAAWPQVGVMIEVPSAAWQAAQLAIRVDFLTVGTNDLTQYLLAVDRDNARVAGLYDHLHPAMLKTIAHIIDGSHQVGRPVQLSGEMATHPGAAILLLGLGADSLNASPVTIPKLKLAIRRFTRDQARQLAEHALSLDTVGQVHRLLRDTLHQVGLAQLVYEGF